MAESTAFPFPGRELAGAELSRDYCYGKIKPEDREGIARSAWEKGENAAREIFIRFEGEGDFFVIAHKSGLTCEWVDKDYVLGNLRYFSDYLSGRKQVCLYARSIDLWAAEHGFDRRQAGNLILSHEYFHHLECTKLGLTSRMYQVPMLILGPLKIGSTGIRALSEIGAHGFARTYYDLSTGREEIHENKT
jgi:hypothetical protein